MSCSQQLKSFRVSEWILQLGPYFEDFSLCSFIFGRGYLPDFWELWAKKSQPTQELLSNFRATNSNQGGLKFHQI